MTKLTYVRIFADESGQSHLEEQCIEVGRPEAALSAFPTQFSDPIAVTAARFSLMPPHFVAEWHTAPRRQYSLHLSGELEVEVGDGQKCRLGPGSIVLLEDVSGQGHRTTVIGDEPVVGVFLHLP
jgi:hypothetical protein